jgi:hypothetical protein
VWLQVTTNLPVRADLKYLIAIKLDLGTIRFIKNEVTHPASNETGAYIEVEMWRTY